MKVDTKCVEVIVTYNGLARYKHRCNYNRKVGEYCGIHDPDRLRRLRDKNDMKSAKDRENRKIRQAKRVLDALGLEHTDERIETLKPVVNIRW